MNQLERAEPAGRQRVHVGLFVDVETRQQLVEVAKRQDRSVSAVVRQALRGHLAHELEREQKP